VRAAQRKKKMRSRERHDEDSEEEDDPDNDNDYDLDGGDYFSPVMHREPPPPGPPKAASFESILVKRMPMVRWGLLKGQGLCSAREAGSLPVVMIGGCLSDGGVLCLPNGSNRTRRQGERS
jgi:hypothetical protein